MNFSYRWLGNAGFEFRFGKQILMIDPFLTRPGRSCVYSGKVEPDARAIEDHITKCDHILVSHTHFDHFMDVPEIARRTGAVIHGSRNTCHLAQAQGVPENQTHLIHSGDNFKLDDIQIKVIPATHSWIPGYSRGNLNGRLKPPLRLRDYRMDTNSSFLISVQRQRILIWSSIRTDGAIPAEVLICRAGYGRRWYERVMNTVRPRLVIPSHWDDMFRPLSELPRLFFSPPRLAFPPIQRINLGKFERKIKQTRPESEVLVPERFKEYTIEI